MTDGVKKYCVKIGYSMKEWANYIIPAHSPENAIDIAMFKLKEDRLDFDKMTDFQPQVKEENP